MLAAFASSRSAAISSNLDLSLRTLDGDHIRPLAQALVDLPPEVARVANQAAATGGTLLGMRVQTDGPYPLCRVVNGQGCGEVTCS